MLFFSKFIIAGQIHFEPGQSTTTARVKGSSFTSSSGYLSSFAAANYTVYLSSSGDFSVSDFYILINGIRYYDGYGVWLMNTFYDLVVHYKTPQNVSCGATSTFTIILENVAGQQSTANGYILIVNGNVSGTTDICGFNTTVPFLLSFKGDLSGNGVRTWNINKSGWKINGQNPPIQTSSFDVTITSPNQAGSATLTISGDYLCSNIVKSLYCNPTVPPAPTTLSKRQLGSTCYYSLTTTLISAATSYEWSCHSNYQNSEITTSNTTHSLGTDCPDLLEDTYSHVYVRARNGCGNSSTYHQYIYFPPLENCYVKSSKINGQPEEDSEPYNSQKASDVSLKIAANGLYELILRSEYQNLSIAVYNGNGCLIKIIKPILNTADIDLRSLSSGLYFIKITSNELNRTIKILKY